MSDLPLNAIAWFVAGVVLYGISPHVKGLGPVCKLVGVVFTWLAGFALIVATTGANP